MRLAVVALATTAVLAATGCGGRKDAKPKDDPGKVAMTVVDQITRNHYAKAWADLHPDDQRVAPLAEYVRCETRSPVIARPSKVKVVRVKEESVGLGNGTFVDSTAVDLRLGFAGDFSLVHTVHLVASDGSWKWILPAWRFRDYKADRCPTDPGSSPPPSNS
jgi:hypothetical protein